MRLEDNSNTQDRDLNGCNVSGAITIFRKSLAIKADVSGHYGNVLVSITDKPKKAPCLQRGDEFGIVESSRRFSLQTPNFLLYNAHALIFAASAYRKPMCADVWL